ncbi:tubulin polyglutamylase TTLL4-like isoform X1 [Scyliorhinus canicula]|uniref:tubulin polyglutamylase TTLL4-like isoform X1 n=1 Tax=Scyliorhinus canicula TaxID=7830 RepID=UPI0018F512A6|nr:tubulin polyglutamylase TTLL4-like isoform X1 [Scyliorhinus canicula]XP_038646047.1 tubulin polyglutamylase TTLL4-like isoform X1 [Scyliorhinus canicula]
MAAPKTEEYSTDPSCKNNHKTSLNSSSKSYYFVQPQEGRPAYSVSQHPLWEWDGYNVILPVRKQNTCSGTSQYVGCHPYPSFPGGNGKPITLNSHTGFRSNILISPFEKTSTRDRTGHGYRSYQRLESLGSRFSGLGSRITRNSYINDFIPSLPSRAISCENLMKPNSAITPVSQHCGSRSAGYEPLLLGRSSPSHAVKPTSLYPKPLLNTNAFMRPTSAKVPTQQKWGKNVKPSALNGNNEFGDSETAAKHNGSSARAISGSALHVSTDFKIERPFNQNEHFHGNLKSAIKLTKNNAGDPELKFTEATKRLSEDRVLRNHVFERCVTFSKETESLSSQGFHFQNGPFSSAAGLLKRTVPNLTPERNNFQTVLKAERIYANANLEPTTKENSASKENVNARMNKTPIGILSTNVRIQNNSPVSFTGSSALHHESDQIKKLISVSAPKTTVGSVTLQIAAMQLKCANKIEKTLEKPKSEACSQDSEPDTDEEEFDDGLEEISSQECDEESECSTVSDSFSTESTNGISKVTFNELPECADAKNVFTSSYPQGPECKIQLAKPALIKSLFHDMPLTIYFGTSNEKIELLPWDQRKQMKWKMSTVTPIVVKNTIARSHFKITKRCYDWLGCWGHHMKSPLFKTLREYQKLNHFPGSFQIGRKDRLWRNLLRMQLRFGKREFNFFPQSYILPHDIKLLKNAWGDSSSRQKWIIKPPASARGIGIQVIHRWNQIPKKRPLLVQKYLHRPYLIGESKFDLRIYVYVTSYDPLRIYVFTDGLVRFASCKYSSSVKSLSNKFMHLTNYSVNKLNAEYKPNSDGKLCQGHKWSLKALWAYLNQKGVRTELLWEQMKDVIIKTIIASDSYVNSQIQLYVRNRYTCHELFGFDIMLDENLKPWVLEVNISPSLHSNSILDVTIKGQMISDLLNLAGFIIPQKDDVTPIIKGSSTSRPKSNELSPDEKLKRVYYLSQKSPPANFYSSLLDILTPDDIRMLMESEDEYNRRGQFERVFPCQHSSRYLRLFEQPRYFNILLDLWEQKYGQNRQSGINILKELSYRRIHLGLSIHPSHIWHPPGLKFTPNSDLRINGESVISPSQSRETMPKKKITVNQEPNLAPLQPAEIQQSS